MARSTARFTALLLMLGFAMSSSPAFADAPRSHSRNALDVVRGIQGANVSDLAGAVISRSVPGGNTLVTNNGQLRQPDKQELADRAAVFRDLPSIRRRSTIRPVQNKTDIARIRKRLATIVQRMRKRGTVTRRDLQEYAAAMSPLYVYERDLSEQQRIAQIERGKPVRIYPGEKLIVSYHGNCTDHNLPAPGANEEVSFKPGDAIFPKQLQPVMADVVRYGARHADYPTQALVWFARGLGGSEFDPTQYSYMAEQIELAHPGGWNIVSHWAQEQAGIAARKQFFTSLALNLLNRSGLDSRLTNALLSSQDLMRSLQGSRPEQLAQLVSEQMQVIRHMQPSGERPNDMSALSRVHGFDAVAEANGLQVQGVLYNAQPASLLFDPNAPMIAEAERPTQRAFGVPGAVGFGDHQDVDPTLRDDVGKTIHEGLHDLLESPAGKMINGIVKGADKACTMLGLPTTAGAWLANRSNIPQGFHLYNAGQTALNVGQDVLNVFHVAAFGTNMDGEPAPPTQRFISSILAVGTVAAGIAAAPEIAASLGIEAGMTATEAVASALEAAANGIDGLAADAQFADESSVSGKICDGVNMAATGSGVLEAVNSPSPSAWAEVADHLLGWFHLVR